MKRRKRPNPQTSILVIHNFDKGTSVMKRIKNSARTADILHQYYAKSPNYFVYRVNVYPKRTQNERYYM